MYNNNNNNNNNFIVPIKGPRRDRELHIKQIPGMSVTQSESLNEGLLFNAK
jgi:hypothetical protein